WSVGLLATSQEEAKDNVKALHAAALRRTAEPRMACCGMMGTRWALGIDARAATRRPRSARAMPPFSGLREREVRDRDDVPGHLDRAPRVVGGQMDDLRLGKHALVVVDVGGLVIERGEDLAQLAQLEVGRALEGVIVLGKRRLHD